MELFESVKDDGFDFFLTAQGGLKGTSKPVYYRVLLNENYVWKPTSGKGSPLTADMIKKVTFAMSHQYGTATKATRMIPVIHYARRLAETAIGYVKCKFKNFVFYSFLQRICIFI